MEQAFWTKRWIAWISVYWQWKAIPFFFSLSCLLFLFTDGCYTFFSRLSICSLDARTFCIFHFGVICRAVVVVAFAFFTISVTETFITLVEFYIGMNFTRRKAIQLWCSPAMYIFHSFFVLEYIRAKLRLYTNVR